jgi:hypothetical protein
MVKEGGREGWRKRLVVRWEATEARMEDFLALAAKPLRAEEVRVEGRKMLM